MQKFFINPKGFSLVEILVSVCVILMISSLFLANYSDSRSANNLNLAAQKVVSDIRKTQEFSLGLKYYGAAPPDGGWGIYFKRLNANDADRLIYRIYADADEGYDYDAGERYGRDISLPPGIEINNLRLDSNNRNEINATYEPPDPTVHLIAAAAPQPGSEAIIELKNEKGDIISIIINKFGLVDVQ